MNKLIAVFCGLVLTVSTFGLALGASPAQNPPPMSKKEYAEKQKALHSRMANCSANAQGKGLKAGTPAFDRFVSDCLNG